MVICMSMRPRERLTSVFRGFSVEVLAIWFAFRDRRVRWYAKLLLVLPIAYVASPVDLLADNILFWGQIDDIIVLRISYYLITKFIDPAVLADGREKAAAFLDASRSNRLKFAAIVTLIWGFVIFLVARYLLKKFLVHH